MLRPATLNDLITVASWITSRQGCAFWAGAAASYPLNMDTLATDAKFSPETSYCIDRDESMVAFGMLRPLADGRGHLSRLIVAPALRGQGIGKTLVQQLLVLAAKKRLRSVSLWVEPSNNVAVRLYTGLGFVRTEPPGCITPSSGSWYMVRQSAT